MPGQRGRTEPDIFGNRRKENMVQSRSRKTKRGAVSEQESRGNEIEAA